MPIPLRSDRSAWDTVNYPDLHAKDIEDNASTSHLPTPTSGKVLVGNGTTWEPVTYANHVHPHEFLFPFAGTLSVGDSPFRIYNRLGLDLVVSEVYLSTGTSGSPSGDDIIVTLYINGSEITSGSNRPMVLDGNTEGEKDMNYSFVAGSWISCGIVQVGSGSPGSDLMVHVITAWSSA